MSKLEGTICPLCRPHREYGYECDTECMLSTTNQSQDRYRCAIAIFLAKDIAENITVVKIEVKEDE